MKLAQRSGAVTLILTSTGLGQTIGPEIKLSAGAGPVNRETAIGVSRTTDDVLAVWQSPSRIRYAASINSGLTFGEWSDLTPPLCADTPNGFDPMVAESQYTGELWAGGISAGAAWGRCSSRARRPARSSSCRPSW